MYRHLYLELYSSHASMNEEDVSFVYWTVGLQEVEKKTSNRLLQDKKWQQDTRKAIHLYSNMTPQGMCMYMYSVITNVHSDTVWPHREDPLL